MIGKLREMNSALPGLVAGILLWGLVCEVFVLIFAPDRANHSIGLLIGVLVAVGMSIHMAYSLNIAVTLDEKGAKASAVKNNLLRYTVVVVIFAILMVTGIGNPLVAFLGVLGLKVSAYLQPLLEKFSKGREKPNCESSN